MKNLYTLVFICLLATLSCKKSNSTPSISITGKWLHKKTILKSDQNGTLTPIETTTYSDPNKYVQFNSNGTGLASQLEGGSYITTNFTYTISNKNLTLVSAGETENDTITVLSLTDLVLQSAPFKSGSSLQVSDDYFSK
jgi:hypothetical protein